MKRFLVAALLLLCGALSASAQTSTKTCKEPRVRFGVGYRYSLGIAEKYHGTTTPDKSSSDWMTPDYMGGGELRFEGTVRVTDNWNVGLGIGAGLYDATEIGSFPLPYLKVEYLYGKRPGRWFNYAELGTTVVIPEDKPFGLMSGIGGGYRFAMTRRTRFDFTVGLEYLNFHGTGNDYDMTGPDTSPFYAMYNADLIHRIGITFGIAMHF